MDLSLNENGPGKRTESTIAGFRAVDLLRWGLLSVLLFLYVFLTRTWGLADKVMHHDESLFAYYGFWLYRGNGYDYQPILHGPILQFASAFFFFLFGDNQWTMRMPSLVGGLLMFPLLWYWRRYLGWYGMVGAMVLVALSPSLTFYTRFLRNDVPYLTATMWCAYCVLRLFDRSAEAEARGKKVFAWGAVLTATLMFSMMESSIFFFAACLGFLGTILVWDLALGLFREKDRGTDEIISETSGQYSLIDVLLKTLILTMLTAGTLIWLFRRMLLETVPVSTPFIQVCKGIGIEMSVTAGNIVAAAVFSLVMFALLFPGVLSFYKPSGYSGLYSRLAKTFWSHKWSFIGAVALAILLYTTAFTTFFTHTSTASFDHTSRDFSGPVKPLTPVQIYKNTWDYWWDQHKLHRIKGPFHYYLPILFLYELPVLLLVFAGWWRMAFRKKEGETGNGSIVNVNRFLGSRVLHLAVLLGMQGLLAVVLMVWGGKIDWAYMDVKFHVTHAAHLFLALFYVQMLTIVVPIMFFKGYRVEAFVSYWAITALFAYSYAGEKVPWLTVHVVGPLTILGGFELAKIFFRRNSYGKCKRIALGIAIILGLIYQVRNQHLLQFVHPWSPVERLVYNHTTPDLQDALAQIEIVEKEGNFGKQLPIYMEGEMGWPLHWYLRAYTNITPSPNETADNTTRPIVMVDWHQAGNENLSQNYDIQRMKVREWWEPPMLDFGKLSDIWRVLTPRESQGAGLNGTQTAGARNEWRKLWRYLAYREIWLDPSNPTFTNGANEFALCIRKDLREQVMNYRWLSKTPKRQDIAVFNEVY